MITADNETEFAGNETIAEMMNADFYFTHHFAKITLIAF